MGIKSVISHPERHNILINNYQVLFKWVKYGGCIQITAGSLLGRFGEAAKKASWNFLIAGLPVIVATDSHNTSTRSPCMRAAYELIRFKMGEDTAKTVCMENPGRLVEGREVLILPSRKINMGVYGRFSSIFGKQPHTLHT
jgi:protein-tyrosine phosphatase